MPHVGHGSGVTLLSSGRSRLRSGAAEVGHDSGVTLHFRPYRPAGDRTYRSKTRLPSYQER